MSVVFRSGTITQDTPGTVDVGVLFGSKKVIVPNGARVTTQGGMIFGSVACRDARNPAKVGGPAITVKGAAAFGSVQILTAAEAAANRNGGGTELA